MARSRAPGLPGIPGSRRRSVQNLRNVILSGIPAAGMPPFQLPDATLDALVALVKSLNSPAADSNVPGDREAGKEFFLGKGQCASCHMVYGAGEPIGPDLSNVARELTVDQIRQALLQPSAQITSGYALATVRLRDGRTLRGFVRSRTRFDIQLQDLKGVFHPVSLDASPPSKRRNNPSCNAGKASSRRTAGSDRLSQRLVGRTLRSAYLLPHFRGRRN